MSFKSIKLSPLVCHRELVATVVQGTVVALLLGRRMRHMCLD